MADFRNPKRDYSAIADDVVQYYREKRSVRLVAAKFHITQATVSFLCRRAGIEMKRRGNPDSLVGRPKEVTDEEACAFCRAYSRTDIQNGWCMTHRRMTRAANIETCFK